MFTFAFPFNRTATVARTEQVRKPEKPGLEDLVKLARGLMRDGNPQAALGSLAPWKDDTDGCPEARLLIGRALLALNRYPEAIQQLEAFLEFRPESMEGLLAAGIAAARLSEFAKAADLSNRAAMQLVGPARSLLKSLGSGSKPDPVAIEEMMADIEADRTDRDRGLALACALAKAGHFRVAEKYMWVFDVD